MDEEWAIVHPQQVSHMEELMQRAQTSIPEQAESDVLSLTPPDWLPDSFSSSCAQCCRPFKALIRLRHHCRLCGLIFCASCSSHKMLLPPKFLERHPKRVCILCQSLLAPVQAHLASNISQASKVPVFDAHDNISLRSYLNLPYHSNLEADLFKCSNILRSLTLTRTPSVLGPATTARSLLSIPASDSSLLVNGLSSSDPIHGLIILTSLRLGAGWSGSIGTGVVVRRRTMEEGGGWSAPCAVSLMGLGWGLQFGGEVTDVVIALRSQDQLLALIESEGAEFAPPAFSGSGRVFGALGGSMGLSLGPIGRRADASLVSRGSHESLMKPLLSYSKSKGIYLGCSIEGSCLSIRTQVNQRFYGRALSAFDILHPSDQGVPPPPAASLLYDALHALAQKCELIPPPPYQLSGVTIEPLGISGPSAAPSSCNAEDSIADVPDESIEESGEMPEVTPEVAIATAPEENETESAEEGGPEDEIVWGFTSAWGCTPTILSSSLPALPIWRRDPSRDEGDGQSEGTSVEGPAAVFPLSSSSDPTSMPSEDDSRLTSIHSKAVEEEYQWNLFD